MVRNTIEEAVLADSVGIDTFNVAEHYRAGFMNSAGAVVLPAIGARTKRIQLGTAVTVLSTQDPVRVFSEFSTVDAISSGRAQITLGRGALTDSGSCGTCDRHGHDDIRRVQPLIESVFVRFR